MKIKLPFLFITFVLNSFLNIYAQSQDQNYVKTSAYLETVLVESDFTTSFSGWEKKGNVSYTLDNNRLKVNVDNSWEGIKHDLHGFKTITGEVLNIQLVFDKGNTQSNIRLYLKETDPNGNLVNYNQIGRAHV